MFSYAGFLFSALRAFTGMFTECRRSCSFPEDVVHIRNGYVSIWLLRGENGYLAFDAGQSTGGVRRALGKRGIALEDVRHVFLTHSDHDHTGCLELFRKAEVHMASAEQTMVNGTTERTSSGYGVSLGHNRMGRSFHPLEDGETLSRSGRTVVCILTPGHTPGSMCFLVDGKYLFTGDAMALKNGKVAPFTQAFTMDPERAAASIDALRGMFLENSPEFVFTGHHGCAEFIRSFHS